MRSLLAFFKKEILDGIRGGRILILLLIFMLFGIMNPAIAKLTPLLIDLFADELAESGMVIGEMEVDALTSWAQFFKNMPLALIAFILLYGGILTKEYESGTLVLILTKGFARGKVILAKLSLLVLLFTGLYFLSFGMTYAYNAYYWDNGIAQGLLPAVLNLWLFGIFVICLTLLFSVLLRSYGGVLLGVGATLLLLYLIGLVPRLAHAMPTSLMNGNALLSGASSVGDYTVAIAVSMLLSLACIVLSVPLLNKKQL